MSDSERDSFNEDHLLRGALGWQKPRRETTSRLGDSAKEYFGSRLRRLKKNAAVVDVLSEVLDSQFGEHCRLREYIGGVVRLEVDPGPYMHEVKLMSSELIGHLQRRCPRAGLRSIKIVAKVNDIND